MLSNRNTADDQSIQLIDLNNDATSDSTSKSRDDTPPADQSTEKPYFIRKLFKKENLDIVRLEGTDVLKRIIFTKGDTLALEVFTGNGSSVRFLVPTFMKFFYELSKTIPLPSPPSVILRFIEEALRWRHPARTVVDKLITWITTVSSILMRDHKADKRVQAFFDLNEEGNPNHTGIASPNEKKFILSYALQVVISEENRFSKTYLVTSRFRSISFSLRVYNKTTMASFFDLTLFDEKVKKELALLKQISQPGREWPMCPRLLHSFSSLQFLCIATKFCPGGSLENLCKDGPLSDGKVIFLASCLSHALEFLGEKEIVIKTLEVSKVLIDGDGYPVLSDFSLAANVITSAAKANAEDFKEENPELLLRAIYSLTPNECSPGDLAAVVDYFWLGILLVHISKDFNPYEFEALIPFAQRRDATSMIGYLLRDSADCEIAQVLGLMNNIDYRSRLHGKMIRSPLVPVIRDGEDTRHYPFARAPRENERDVMAYEQERTGWDFFQDEPFIDRLHAKSLKKEFTQFNMARRQMKKEKGEAPNKIQFPKYVLDAASGNK